MDSCWVLYAYGNTLLLPIYKSDYWRHLLGIVTITHAAENNESVIVQINLGTTRVLGSGSEKFSLLI